MDLLKKAVFIQGNVWKKDLLLLSAKLKETCKKKNPNPTNAKEY